MNLTTHFTNLPQFLITLTFNFSSSHGKFFSVSFHAAIYIYFIALTKWKKTHLKNTLNYSGTRFLSTKSWNISIPTRFLFLSAVFVITHFLSVNVLTACRLIMTGSCTEAGSLNIGSFCRCVGKKTNIIFWGLSPEGNCLENRKIQLFSIQLLNHARICLAKRASDTLNPTLSR